jgi:hypothetical protein
MSIYQHSTEHSDGALEQAATAALRAPSIFNTQPWQWRIHEGVADLRADRERQLHVVDPQGRLLTMSCGVALHHLRAALAASGKQIDVARLPERDDPDLLARVRVTGAGEPTLAAIRHYESLLIRHTDRRPFERTPVPAETLDALRPVVEANGAHLHLVRADQVSTLIYAADRAATVEITNPDYRAELAEWTQRPPESGDGVPAATTVPPVPRRVPLRDFALGGTTQLAPGAGDDHEATYAILFTAGDDPFSWLQAGEALGAVLVAAVERGAAVSPMSDLVEVVETRETLRRILSGIGHPMLVLRIGLIEPIEGVPATPRRSPEAVIERDAEPESGDQS